MRALVVPQIGEPPRLEELPEPVADAGETLISVMSAPLNPIDVAVAAGRSFAGNPPPPYVPGVEAVGRVERSSGHEEGSLVFTCLDGLGITRNGACAEMTVARDAAVARLPVGVDPSRAAALGTAGLAAWIPLTRLAPVRADDVVLVLGATGTVGLLAVQIAKARGARRVVAGGRRESGLAAAAHLGADAVVNVGHSEGLADAIRTACEGEGPTLIFDPLWGDPLLAAIDAAPHHARVLQLGQSAGATATLASSVIRGKSLSITGYTTLNLPIETVMESFGELVGQFEQGNIVFDVENVPLEDAPEAWQRQVTGPAAKLVICP